MINRNACHTVPVDIDGSQDEPSIFNLPLIAQYKLLSFFGLADGTNLALGFNIQDIQQKEFVLKSFRVIPYCNGATVDLYVTDGVTTNAETIPNGARMDRIFDLYANNTSHRVFCNGSPLGIFSQLGAGHYPLDLDLDNIFYRFPAKIQTLNVQVDSAVYTNIQTGATADPIVKVLIECYLI